MKSVLVIGIGRFGSHLARRFAELENEVMVVDKNEDAIGDLVSVCTSVQIGDCTKKEVLSSLGVANFDLCFVCIGEDFKSSLVITAMLKDLGAKKVISKAGGVLHEEFLLRNGADEVIYAERDMAQKTATMHSRDKLRDYMPLTDDVSIYEIMPLEAWVGKSIGELGFRTKYHATILATKRGEEVFPLPTVDYRFHEQETLMIMGRDEDVEKLFNLLSKE